MKQDGSRSIYKLAALQPGIILNLVYNVQRVLHDLSTCGSTLWVLQRTSWCLITKASCVYLGKLSRNRVGFNIALKSNEYGYSRLPHFTDRGRLLVYSDRFSRRLR